MPPGKIAKSKKQYVAHHIQHPLFCVRKRRKYNFLVCVCVCVCVCVYTHFFFFNFGRTHKKLTTVFNSDWGKIENEQMRENTGMPDFHRVLLISSKL